MKKVIIILVCALALMSGVVVAKHRAGSAVSEQTRTSTLESLTEDPSLDQEHPVREETLKAIDPYAVAEWCENHPDDKEICEKKQ